MPKPYNGVTEKSKRKIGKFGLGSDDGLKIEDWSIRDWNIRKLEH